MAAGNQEVLELSGEQIVEGNIGKMQKFLACCRRTSLDAWIPDTKE
jgi:hypothetical protein